LTRKQKKSKNKKKQLKPNEEAKREYEIWRENNPEIVEVAEKFIFANCYNPNHVKEFLNNYEYY
jgi:putative transposase